MRFRFVCLEIMVTSEMVSLALAVAGSPWQHALKHTLPLATPSALATAFKIVILRGLCQQQMIWQLLLKCIHSGLDARHLNLKKYFSFIGTPLLLTGFDAGLTGLPLPMIKTSIEENRSKHVYMSPLEDDHSYYVSKKQRMISFVAAC